LLEKAWRKFSAGARTDLRPLFERFGQDQAHWLDDYALFRALRSTLRDLTQASARSRPLETPRADASMAATS
jgi:4-alpha-glucanotransferase